MAVERLRVEEVTPRHKEATPVAPSPAEANSQMLATFRAIAMILAIRLFLFLSLVGTFVLAMIATANKDPASLWVMIGYSFLTTGPLAFLEWRGKKNGG